MNSRRFSLEEANALLPELDSRLARLIHKKEAYARCHDELLMHELLVQAEYHAGTPADPDGIEADIRAVEAAIEDMEKEIEQIRALGCVLRSIDRGWVDFLATRDGETIYFCWRRGEKSIQFFRSARGGMTARQPL